MTASTMTGAPRRIWLRSPWWDVSLLAFCWLPFYLWVVFGLGLGQNAWGLPALSFAESQQAILLAAGVALGTTYIHRHYTLLLVYGDRSTFTTRAKHYLLAPLLLLVVIGLARWSEGSTFAEVGPLHITTWGLIVVIGTLWNIWHTVQQRYGILRAYGGRSRKGLESHAHARRDFWLLWSAVLGTAVLVLSFQRETFTLHSSTHFIDRKFGPFLDDPSFMAFATAIGLITLGTLAWWLRHELRADLAASERAPRWIFLASTWMLLAVFVWHGPIVGFLCFGVAHALEYLAFVHHYGQRKYQANPGGLAAALLSRPWLSVPLLVSALVSLYFLLYQYKSTDLYIVYYITTSWLHFLYDGWIWKVRKSDVAKPLGIASSAP